MAKNTAAQRSKSSENKQEMTKPSDDQVRNIRPRPEPKPRRAQQRRSRKAKHFPAYAAADPKRIPDGPDVLVDVPVAKVDEVDVEVDDLRAQVAVMAEVRKILMLSVGADAKLGQVELKIEGVEAQALLKARLKNVHAIVERAAVTLDRNPELLASIGRGIEEVGEGGEEALGDVGKGAGEAVGEVGKGARRGVAGAGKGAKRGVAGTGRGAKRGGAGTGRGAKRGVAGAGRGAKQGAKRLSGRKGR